MAAGCSGTPESIASTPSATLTIGAPASLEEQFIAVASKVSPSVVAIHTDVGVGSGVVFDQRGDIVTNAHVDAGSKTHRVFLATGQSYAATLVGSFAPDDLAVLHIAGTNLTAARFADSDRLRVGSIVMAIGSPLGRKAR